MNRRAASPDAQLAPLIKQVRVLCSVERAFELFTERMSDWWPLQTHSVARTGQWQFVSTVASAAS
jgi:hypothetical protein